MRHQLALVDDDIFAVAQRLQCRRIGGRTADAEFFHLLDQRGFRIARRRFGEVLAGVDLLLGEVFALVDRRQTAFVITVVALFTVFLLVGIGGDEAVEADHRTDGAQARLSPPLPARISTVVRSISADAIWLAIPRFQIRS